MPPRLPSALLALAAVASLALAACGGNDGGSVQSAGASGQTAGSSEPGHGPKITDWPLFGRTLERTHAISSAPGPPFHFNWQFFAHQLLEFPPALADGVLYTVNKTGGVYAVRTRDGKPIWSRNLDDDVTGPTYGDGLVFLGQYDGSFAALDAKTGHERWSFDAHTRLESSPLVAEHGVYFGSDDGNLWALEDSTGKVDWKTDLGAPVKASPSFHDGVLYVGDYAGNIHAVDARTGKVDWTVDTTEIPPGGDGGFYSSPAIAFGRLYEARDDGAVFAVSLSGHPEWHFETRDAIYGSPAVADIEGLGPMLYIGSYDQHLYALDAANGARRWSYDVGGEIPGSPTIVNDTVYTSSFETKKTTGLEARTGKPVFKWGSAGYDPMISDGRQVFLSGFQTVWAFSGKRSG